VVRTIGKIVDSLMVRTISARTCKQPSRLKQLGAEPDATWGPGGIDDWGWTAGPRRPVEPQTTEVAEERLDERQSDEAIGVGVAE
jgi:hypothetical protein